MAPVNVLVTVMPFAGHVAPVTRAVEALLRAGHRVRVYVGSAYTSAFESIGATAIPWHAAPDFDEQDLRGTFPEVGRRGPRGLLANVEHIFIRSGTGQVADLVAEFEDDPWDVLLADSLSIGGALAAERTGTPWATLSVVPLSMPSRDLPPPNLVVPPARGLPGRIRDSALRALVELATGALRRSYRDTRASVGLDPRGKRMTEAWFSPFVILALGVPGLETPRSDLPDHVHFIGAFPPPVTASPAAPRLRDLLSGTEPVVHVTQGTFNTDPHDLLEPSLDALADPDVSVVATTGRRGRNDLPFPVPANALVVDLAPYAELLPRSSQMITNGGWGGVLAALAQGVPLIIAGDDLDKPAIAAMVARSGSGIDLRTGRPTARTVARAVDRIRTDPRYAERTAGLAAEFAAHDTAAEVVALLQVLADTSAPVRRSSYPWPTVR